MTEARARHESRGFVADWLALQEQLARLRAPAPCQHPATAARWIADSGPDQEAAAHACTPCPALAICRTYALAARELAGVWGGTTPADRRARTDDDR